LNLLDRACFSSEELPTVIERVGRWAGSTSVAHSRADAFPAEFSDATAVGRWIDSIAGKASFEVEQEHLSYRAFRSAMKRLAPLVLRVTESAQPVFIVVVGCVGKTVVAVGRDLKRVRLDCEALRDFLFRVQRSAVLQEIEQLLKHAGVGRGRRRTSLRLLLGERLADTRISDCWTLRLGAGASIWQHARDVGQPAGFGQLIIAYAAAYVLWILSWWVLGFSALRGRLDRGWIGVWVLLLVTMVPLRLFTTWMQGSSPPRRDGYVG